mgnify:FL=1
MKISRIDIIGQNGNTGEHYSEVPMNIKTVKKFDTFVDKVCNWLEDSGFYVTAKKLSRWHLECMEKGEK